MNWDLTRPHESLAEVARICPEIMRYAENWGRPGDEGFVAEEAGEPVGAAWFRVFPEDSQGFGRLSLSVFIVNPARTLYERLGFVKAEDDDEGYRTMVLVLND